MLREKRNLQAVLSVLLLISMALAGCGGMAASPEAKSEAETSSGTSKKADRKKITFAIWDEVQQPVFEDIVKEFEKENPEIDVTLQLTPWSQYWTKLDAAMGAGTAADIFWMNTFMPKYANAGVLEPLDSYIEKDKMDMSNYEEVVADMYNYNNVQYGLPKGMDTVQVFYNKKILQDCGVEEPREGWNWDDMINMAIKIKEKKRDIYPILMELDGQPSYINFIYQSGGYVLDKSGKKSGMGEEGTKKAYSDILSLIQAGLMPDSKILSDTKGTDLFLSQKGAILFMGSWKTSVLDEASFGDQIGVIGMPAREKGNQSVIGGLCYAMNSNCKNKEEAWKLMKFLAGETSNKMQAETGIDIPALKSAQGEYQTKNIDTSVYLKAAETGFAYPSSPSIADWNQILTEYSAKILSAEISVDEGCDEMNQKVQAVLDEE